MKEGQSSVAECWKSAARMLRQPKKGIGGGGGGPVSRRWLIRSRSFFPAVDYLQQGSARMCRQRMDGRRVSRENTPGRSVSRRRTTFRLGAEEGKLHEYIQKFVCLFMTCRLATIESIDV
jgi:hypothetical protein